MDPMLLLYFQSENVGWKKIRTNGFPLLLSFFFLRIVQYEKYNKENITT